MQNNSNLQRHVDERLPISLRYQNDLLERIHNLYPHLPKYKVAIIIQAFFETVRGLLLADERVTIKRIFSMMHLTFYLHKYKGITYPMVKVSLSTPKAIKFSNE